MSLTFEEYARLAARTASPFNSEKEKLLCAALGLGGEAGEVIDRIKKGWFQGHELDGEKIAEELGDVLWYVALGAAALGIPMETIAQRNVDKLKQRYPDGFSSERSVNRNDK